MYFSTPSRCPAETSGPTLVSSRMGSPTTRFLTRSSTFWVKTSRTERCTMARLVAVHFWPADSMAPLTVSTMQKKNQPMNTRDVFASTTPANRGSRHESTHNIPHNP